MVNSLVGQVYSGVQRFDKDSDDREVENAAHFGRTIIFHSLNLFTAVLAIHSNAIDSIFQ